jgi:hypothetical protein
MSMTVSRVVLGFVRSMHWKQDASHMCNAYNYATCPSEARSEREHFVCDRLARKCHRWLSRCPNVKEDENGRMVVVH